MTERIERRLGQTGLLATALAGAGLLWIGAYHYLLPLTQWVAYALLGLSAVSPLGSAVAFFIYDVPKVLLLLTAIVFLVGILRSFVTPERARSILGGGREGALAS